MQTSRLCVIEGDLLPIKFLHCENKNFRPFAPVTLTSTVFRQDVPADQNKIPTSRLSKVVVLQTDGHAYTHASEIIYHSASWVATNNVGFGRGAVLPGRDETVTPVRY